MGKSREVMQVQNLPLNPNDHRAPLWWGMAGLIAIEATLFAAIITAYFYLRLFSQEWPIGGIQPPELLLPTIGTVLLLSSSAPVYWANHRGLKGDLRSLKIGLVVGLVLIAAFLGLMVYELNTVGYSWNTNAYASLVFFIIGLHLAHVMVAVLLTAVVLAAAVRGHFNKRRTLGVQINGLFWHFVVIAWLPLYFTLYWSPIVFGIKGG